MTDFEQRLARLRNEFDDAFRLPLAPPPADLQEFLIVVAGGGQFALRLSDLSGLEVDRKVVPIPRAAPLLLGLAAVEGQLIPVFDLARLLGTGSHEQAPRWMVLYRDREPFGLAFDDFRGSRRLPAGAVRLLEADSDADRLSRQALQIESGLISVVDLAALASSIRRATNAASEGAP